MPYLNRPSANRVALWMGDATRDVLWELYGDRVEAQEPGIRLRTRVANGKATNHRVEGIGRHVISYGWKMVQDKLASATSAAGWLSAKELRGRRYFGGEFTPLNLLAHTVCHEFAHLLQVVDGDRTYRSVHNAAFYRLLRELHDDGAADLVRDFLQERVAASGLSIEWVDDEATLATTLTLARRPRPARPSRAMTEFRRGERVTFDARGGQVTGWVKRINRRTVTVVPDDSPDEKRWWRVSPWLLRRVS